MGSAGKVARAIFYAGAIGVVIALGLLGPKDQVLAQSAGTDVPTAGTLEVTQVPARARAAQAQAPAAPVNQPLLVRDPAALQQAKRAAADRAAGSERSLSPVTSSVASLPPYGVYNGTNFPGISAGGGTPSDSTGAIGPTHYVEMVNSAIGVRPRSGGSMTTMALAAFGARSTTDCTFDPQISWDQQGGRWLYSFDDRVPTTNDCRNISADYVAVGWSKTSDPSDLVNGWCHFTLNTGAYFFDYDKLGHDNNFISIGVNVFTTTGTSSLTAVIVAIPKPAPGDVSCTAPASATYFGSPAAPLMNADGTYAFTPVPTDTADSSPVGYIVAAHDPGAGSANKVMVWHLSSNAGAPVLIADGDVTVASYGVPPDVPQPATGVTSCSTSGNCLNSLDARLTQAVAHFDPDAGVETIWTQHTVVDAAAGPRSVERWYELIPGRPSPRQSGNVSDSSLHIFNGAISPSSAGNEAVIFYNAGNGSAGAFASMRAQSRNSAAPLGTMTNETIIASSTVNDNDLSCGVNRSPASAAPCRWGDYSGARPDPIDANAVWGTSMLTGTGGTSTTVGWATQVAAYTPGCVSATISPKVASGVTGSTNQFTATSTGCSNPQYQFLLQFPAGTGAWVVKQSFGPSAVWNWDTLGYAAGNYAYAVWANQTGDSTANWEAYDSGSFTLTQAPTCASAVLSPPNSSVNVGTTINFSATASGCPIPVFQYLLQDPRGTTIVKRPFGTDPTWAWNTTGLVPGTYKVIVWANQRGDQTSTAEATATTTLTITGCASVSVSASPPSPSLAGTQVAFTAIASGCPNPRYQFWMRAASQTDWQLLQTYSAGATYNWNSTGAAAGDVYFGVWAKDASSGSTYFDANASIKYSVTTPPPCASVTVSALPASPSSAGTQVTFTANASGCSAPRYQFWMRAASQADWQLLQAYSPSNTYNWNSTGAAAGVVYFGVWAKDAGSLTSGFDANASLPYSVTTPSCASVTASAAPTTVMHGSGTHVIVTAAASGCTNGNPLYEFWLRTTTSDWQLVQNYSTTATYDWNTTGAPVTTVYFGVWAKDAKSSTSSFDANASVAVPVT